MFRPNAVGVDQIMGIGDYAGQGMTPNIKDLESTYLQTVNKENNRSRGMLDSAIEQLGMQAGRTFNRNILPGITDQAAAAGQYSSSKEGIAEGLAASEVQTNLNQQIGQMELQDLARQDINRENALNRAFRARDTDIDRLLGARDANLNRALQASSQMPTAMQAYTMPMQLREQVANQRNRRAQLELDDQISIFNAPRQADVARLNELASIVYGAPLGTTITEAGSGSPITGALGGAATGAGIGFQIGGPAGAGYGALAGGAAGLIGSL